MGLSYKNFVLSKFIKSPSSGNRNTICLRNQHGQAIIELAFLMTFLAIILLSMVIIHELGMKNTIAVDLLRQRMIESVHNNAGDRFKLNTGVKEDVFVVIPGKMKQYLGRTHIKVTHKITFYEGSYKGKSKNQYRRPRPKVRKIEL